VTIWKYITHDTATSFDMPDGARILHAGEQHGQICVWALVDPSAPLKPRVIKVVGTGWLFTESNLTYIGTVTLEDGALVFHVFEVTSA